MSPGVWAAGYGAIIPASVQFSKSNPKSPIGEVRMVSLEPVEAQGIWLDSREALVASLSACAATSSTERSWNSRLCFRVAALCLDHSINRSPFGGGPMSFFQAAAMLKLA